MYSVRSLLFWRKGCCRGGELIRYENFFYRDDDNGAAFKAASLRVLRAVSRSANGTIEIANKDGHTSEMLLIDFCMS